jgi:hypothetical protein
MAVAAVPASPRDLESLADLDAITGSVIERGRLAIHLGADEGTLSRWWSGARPMPIAALLAIGRRVVSGSPDAGARWVEALAAAIGLRGSWRADAKVAPANLGTIVDLAVQAGAGAQLLQDGVIACDEVDQARVLAQRLRAAAAALDAAADEAAKRA